MAQKNKTHLESNRQPWTLPAQQAADLRPLMANHNADWAGTEFPGHATELARQAGEQGLRPGCGCRRGWHRPRGCQRPDAGTARIPPGAGIVR